MSRVIAIPFSARPPKGWCAPLREMFPGVKIVASQPINSTGVKGPDQLIWHVNTSLKNAERVAYYANNIMGPLIAAAAELGDLVLFMHETVIIEQAKANSLWGMLEKMGTLQFSSAQPTIRDDGILPRRITDWPSRFLVLRSETVMQWFEPFPVDAQGRSTMSVVMQRIQDDGRQPGSSYYWDMQMTVNEV